MLGQSRLKVVIHGGMHKTGTTSIQSVLNSNKAGLQAYGFLFVSEANDGLSHCLDVRLEDWHVNKLRTFVDQALNSGFKKLLLSHEVVSLFSLAQFKQLTDIFYDCDLSYIFFFRHWREFLPSRWKQYCLRRDTQTFNEYLSMLEASSYNHIDWNQALVLDRALESGKCSVRALSYDNAVIQNGSVLPKFLEVCEIVSTASKSTLFTDKQLNQSAPPKSVELVRLFNGVIAAQEGLSQNDLCQSIKESRQCDQFFDLAAKIQKLEPMLKRRWEDTVENSMTSQTLSRSFWKEPEDRLEKHRELFVNRLGCGGIHAHGSHDQLGNIITSRLTWQNFLEMEPSLISKKAKLLFTT
jgi:hypothetical protein